jgi:hypothetical protein
MPLRLMLLDAASLHTSTIHHTPLNSMAEGYARAEMEGRVEGGLVPAGEALLRSLGGLRLDGCLNQAETSPCRRTLEDGALSAVNLGP